MGIAYRIRYRHLLASSPQTICLQLSKMSPLMRLARKLLQVRVPI